MSSEIILDRAGIRELLQSDEVKSACLQEIRQLQGRCSEPGSIDTYVGRTRVNAMLTASAEDIKAIKEALK